MFIRYFVHPYTFYSDFCNYLIGLLLNDTVNEKNIYQVLKNDSKLMTIDVPDDYYLENFYVRP
jgi:hypothetical protein